MFSKNFVPILLLGILFINSGCDETPGTTPIIGDLPTVTSISTQPSSVQFSRDTDGFKDTTLVVTITSNIDFVNESQAPRFVVTEVSTGTVIESSSMESQDDSIYSGTFELETSTTTFAKYLIEVFAANEQGDGNYAQSSFEISGFSNFAPQLLWVDNPEEVQRPATGSTAVQFKAKATDTDGQESIEGVFLRLISQVSGEVAASPFQLFDDGTSFSDEAASDSVFTVSFNINSSNQLQTYDILYYAVDKGGLVSDTLKTTFSIIE